MPNIIEGFFLGNATPIDTRIVAQNATERLNIQYKYDGLKVFQTDTRESWVWNQSIPDWELEGSGTLTGLGDPNYVAKWASTGSLTASNIYIDPSNNNIGVGTTSPQSILQLNSSTTQPFNINNSSDGIGISYNWRYQSGNNVHNAAQGSVKVEMMSQGSSFLVSTRQSGDPGSDFHDLFWINRESGSEGWNILKSPQSGNFINGKTIFDNQFFQTGDPVITYSKPQHVYVDQSFRTNSAEHESVTKLTFEVSGFINIITRQFGATRLNNTLPVATTQQGVSTTYTLNATDRNIILDLKTATPMIINLGDINTNNTDNVGRVLDVSVHSSNSSNGQVSFTATQDIVDINGNSTDLTLRPGESTKLIASVQSGVVKWQILHRVNRKPYKSYVAKLSQSGTSAPTATVMENTFTTNPTFTRIPTGRYNLEITGAFPLDKTFVMIKSISGGLTTNVYTFEALRQDVDKILILSRNESNLLADSLLNDTEIEIRVYY